MIGKIMQGEQYCPLSGKLGSDNCPNSVEAEMANTERSLVTGTCRDYRGNTLNGDDIVRAYANSKHKRLAEMTNPLVIA